MPPVLGRGTSSMGQGAGPSTGREVGSSAATSASMLVVCRHPAGGRTATYEKTVNFSEITTLPDRSYSTESSVVLAGTRLAISLCSTRKRPNPGQRGLEMTDDRRDPSQQELVGRTSASASGRALVPTALSVAGDGRGAHRATGQAPPAAFLAHLIATALKAPQTRPRRRAEP